MAEIISFEKPKQKSQSKKKSEPSQKIIAAIEKYFKKNGYKFHSADSHGIFRTGFSLDCKFKSISVAIATESNGVGIHFIIPVGAGRDKDDQIRIAEFLTRANYGLYSGSFELDLSDGEIFFHDSIYGTEDFVPSDKAMDNLIAYGMAIVEMYGDSLLKVIYDVATPEEAIAEAENSD